MVVAAFAELASSVAAAEEVVGEEDEEVGVAVQAVVVVVLGKRLSMLACWQAVIVETGYVLFSHVVLHL